MTDVFISYSRNDREKVRFIAEGLEREGVRVWWDPEIPPGSTFSQVIDHHLKTAKCVLVIWSSSSINSNWVQEEADDGLSRARLIPIMIDQIELPRGFKRLQTADLTNWRGDRNDPNWQLVLGEVMKMTGQREARHKASAPQAAANSTKERAKSAKPARPAAPKASGKKSGSGGLIIGLLTLLIAAGAGAYFFFGLPDTDNMPSLFDGGASGEAAASTTSQPGDIIKDCDVCPELVVIAPGQFTMGAPASERSHDKTEVPQLDVTIPAPYALGVYEVTYEDWGACLADGGCDGYEPPDQGWGRESRPLIHMSYNHAQSYVRWLSTKTGKTYRLPSEAEWEYAARAGTQTPFSFGENLSVRLANFNGQYPYADAPKESFRGKTVPVGSFEPNAFGLYDMHGNVWEWTQDCWRANHRKGPTDGSAVGGNCSQFVLKGGAWNGGGWRLRSAHRKPAERQVTDYDTGFRVAREL